MYIGLPSVFSKLMNSCASSSKDFQQDFFYFCEELCTFKPLAQGLQKLSMSNKWSNALINLTVASEPLNCGSVQQQRVHSNPQPSFLITK